MILPGMHPGFNLASATSDPATIALFGSATSLSPDLTAPASIAAGDLLVHWQEATNKSGFPTEVVPTNFTSIVSATVGSDDRYILSYKLANGSEGSSTITGMSGNLYEGSCLYVFRRTNTATSLNVVDVDNEGTAGNPTAQTITSGSGNTPLVVFGAYASSDALDPRTFSPTKDGEINPDNFTYLAYKIYNASQANVTVDMDDEGSVNILCSCYIEMVA